ncbi:AMP-binding protein [Mycobacteroides abscessus]|uniref:AMP-binding protein n=1 Tax=Mycobacteroides abscessus TaxID=36809 RepID=UPI00187894F6|nr:AMP-binding protein [Mycobacteroides abscessus]MDM2086004.1 AMP-binding protein [Mycobacteroides abscessus]
MITKAALELPASSGIAVIDDDATYSYDEFRTYVGQWSEWLSDSTCKCVVIDLRQGIVAYSLIWACYLNYVTFVPIYPDTPTERKSAIIGRVNADAVITENLSDSMNPSIEVRTPDRLGRKLDSDNVAYVLFTSGSTAEPKGVMVRRDSLEWLISWSLGQFNIDTDTVWAQYLKLGFDLAIFDVFAAINAGSTLVAFANLGDLLRPFDRIKKYGITHWHTVPTVVNMWTTLTAPDESLASLKNFLFCGEPLYWDQVNRLQSLFPGCAIYNNYGPTETTMFVTSYRVPENASINFGAEATVPLGSAVPGNLVYVDGSGGICGELIVSGVNVAEGYIDGSAGGFHVAVDGSRGYRTGDLCHENSGNLYFDGRADTQIKHHGHRVDLAEIEAVLRKGGYCESYAQLVDGCITLFYSGGAAVEGSLVQYLRTYLPQYMVPTRIVTLDRIPRLSSGKVDRNALNRKTNRG